MLELVANKYIIPAKNKHFAALYYGSEEKFVPNINLSRYNDEAWLNINPKSVFVGNEKPQIINDKIELNIGTAIHRFYELDEKTFEYETEFLSRPGFNIIEFDLLFPEGLQAHYQPALTQDEIAQGANRPDNVVGSYAFYFHKQNNQYTTGKFCHWYYPYLTDADGKITRIADFIVDMATKKAHYYLPKEWLNKAIYPVKLFGTKLGRTDVGGSPIEQYRNIVYAYELGDAVSGGIVDNLAVYLTGGGHTCKFALYQDSGTGDMPEVLRDFTAEIISVDSDWNVTPCTQSYTIVQATKYFSAGWWEDIDRDSAYFDVGAGYDAPFDEETYGENFPNPFVYSSGWTNKRYSTYVEYTEAGVASIVPQTTYYYNMLRAAEVAIQ